MPHSRPGTRRGVTLLELMVVLAVLATTALLVPALRRPASSVPTAPLLAQARRAAVLAGRPLLLRILPDGAWTLEGTGGDTVAQGVLADVADGAAPDAPTSPLVFRLDALGGVRPSVTAPQSAAAIRDGGAP